MQRRPLLNAESTLDEAKAVLRRARQLSKQSRYSRRQPTPESIALFRIIATWARNRLRQMPTDIELLDLLAHVEECLLNYSSSVGYLKAAIACGLPHSRSVAQRLWKLEQAQNEWDELGLSPAQLCQLGEYLSTWTHSEALNSTRGRTEEWLRANYPEVSGQVLTAFDRRGAFTDWQVLRNVVQG